MEHKELTPEETKDTRKMLRVQKAAQTRAAMQKAAKLTVELRAKHGFRNLE